MGTEAETLIYMASFLLLLLLLRVLRKPLRLIFRLALSSLLGGGTLLLLNSLGLSLGLNPITALVAGILGIPGVGVLAFFKYFL